MAIAQANSGGVAAAAHAVGAVPEVYADSTGRLNNAIFAF